MGSACAHLHQIAGISMAAYRLSGITPHIVARQLPDAMASRGLIVAVASWEHVVIDRGSRQNFRAGPTIPGITLGSFRTRKAIVVGDRVGRWHPTDHLVDGWRRLDG